MIACSRPELIEFRSAEVSPGACAVVKPEMMSLDRPAIVAVDIAAISAEEKLVVVTAAAP
ncbi:MAG TPA: hypothetical protein VJY39_21720 [Acidisphaera sp.]|nr:hypothetical protein [Acidisphaera sp.]